MNQHPRMISSDILQMPALYDRPSGDMFIEYSVVMPTKISDTIRHGKFRRSLEQSALS